MGYIRHHAIVVTDSIGEDIAAAHEEARRVFADTACAVSEITGPAVNGYRSFFIAPDGSKEGWDESDQADTARGQFVDWLRAPDRYLSWAEVEFGGDDRDVVAVSSTYGSISGRADDDDPRNGA